MGKEGGKKVVVVVVVGGDSEQEVREECVVMGESRLGELFKVSRWQGEYVRENFGG